MKLNLYQIDAFTDKTFGGNSACVVPLDNWLEDETLSCNLIVLIDSELYKMDFPSRNPSFDTLPKNLRVLLILNQKKF